MNTLEINNYVNNIDQRILIQELISGSYPLIPVCSGRVMPSSFIFRWSCIIPYNKASDGRTAGNINIHRYHMIHTPDYMVGIIKNGPPETAQAPIAIT